MTRAIHIIIAAFVLTFGSIVCSEEIELREYKGVVTSQLLPAKVMTINKVIEDPSPGTSYIGNDGILVEVEENPNVMANWTIVKIEYFKYPEPKTIQYEVLSEQKQLTVSYHAVSVELDGDLSAYFPKD